jgi:Mn2+/Fe2+ NRAMP family transporter
MTEEEKSLEHLDYEVSARTENDIQEPPRKWGELIRKFGPCFVIAGATVGSGELIVTTTLGAKVGFVMLWIILLSVSVKAIIQEQFGRFVISTDDSLMDMLDRIPGKILGASWAVWWGVLLMLSILMAMAGIVGAIGLSVAGFFGVENANLLGLIAAVVGVILILRGLYADLEKIVVTLVVIFSILTIFLAFFLLRATPHAYSFSDILTGLTFRFPAEGWVVALSTFGVTGITANEVATYAYWVKGKGYAAWSGPRETEGFMDRARGWVRVMDTDLVLGAVLVGITTIAYYLLGASVLHKLGLVPSGFETVETISRTYTETLGAWTRYLFMVAAFCILYSTYLVNTSGIARIIPDGLRKIGVIKMDSPRQRIIWRRVFLIGAPAFMLLLYFVIPRPAFLIVVGGVIVGLSMPVAALIGIWLNRIMKRQDPELAQSSTLTGVLWICAAIIIAIQVTGFVIGWFTKG